MESLIETFHIDIKLLIAQVINFAIVFFVLYYFILKPLIKIMQERTKKIEKSLSDAEEIEKKLAQADDGYNKIIIKAKKEAGSIMERAHFQSLEKNKEMVKEAKEEIGQIINQEKDKMQIEKERTLKEIKKETADLVVLSVEKILAEKIDEQKDREMIKKIIKEKKL